MIDNRPCITSILKSQFLFCNKNKYNLIHFIFCTDSMHAVSNNIHV